MGPLRLRAARTGTVAVRVGCPRGELRCQVRLRLTAGGRTLGTATATVAGGATRTLRVRLTRSALRTLRHKGSLRVTAVATATDAAGNHATTRTQIRLLAAREK